MRLRIRGEQGRLGASPGEPWRLAAEASGERGAHFVAGARRVQAKLRISMDRAAQRDDFGFDGAGLGQDVAGEHGGMIAAPLLLSRDRLSRSFR